MELGIGSLTGGFFLADGEPPFRVLTDHEIFRRSRRIRRRRRFRGGAALESVAALKPGDYVVHMDHGIGQFRRMERVRVGEEEFETLVIEYAGGEMLRVPVYRLDLIERWVGDADGDDSPPPKLHRIGGKDWKRAKAEDAEGHPGDGGRAAGAVRGAAGGEGLRRSRRTPAGSGRWNRAFLYEDTPDQRQATEDVKQDMESRRPMDRLICGDVGYGKTEVAIRAAFKAVQDGKQVAVLAPTTILAEQHLHTFSERLAGFPVRIEALSRFRTAKEQAASLERWRTATWTSSSARTACSSPTCKFKDLGLLIVDEEQRFGVKQKELLKELRREGGRADADGDADPAHAAFLAARAARHDAHPDAAARPHADHHARAAVGGRHPRGRDSPRARSRRPGVLRAQPRADDRHRRAADADARARRRGSASRTGRCAGTSSRTS